MRITGAVTQLNELVHRANHISIISHKKPGLDLLNAIVAYTNYLKRHDKQVDLYLPGIDNQVTQHAHLIGEYKRELPPRQTTVRIGLNEAKLRKVQYEVKEGALFLYLTSENGFVDGNSIEFSNEQLESDLFITFGISNPDEVDTWPKSWPTDIKEHTALVNIDVAPTNTQFGSVNIIEHELSSFSELVTDLLMGIKAEVDQESAELLFDGVKHATNQFSQNLTPAVFECAANLMKIINN